MALVSSYYQASSSECEDESVKYKSVNDPLAIIYNEGFWRVNKVSPLCNLDYSAVKLKRYGIKIRQDLVRYVNTNNNVKYTVKFESQESLKYSENDANSLIITVSIGNDNNNSSKIVYMAIILSWGVSTFLQNATHLPYMLERGEQKIGTVVKSSLKTTFDCTIQQFTFTQHQILHGGFMFVQNDTSRANDPFTLVYKNPQANERLCISFDIGKIRLIWNRIQNEDYSHSELAYIAYQLLQNQIFHTNSLDITVFDLYEINMPRAEIKNNGVVKMKTPEAVNCILLLLNEITSHLWKDLLQTSNGSSSSGGSS